MKNFKKWLTVILAFLIVGVLLYLPKNKSVASFIALPNGKQIKIEIADNTFQQAKGLMFRETLDKNSGMLFIFDKPQILTFWMQNTLIPLDMIWLDENYIVVDITKNAQPCPPNTKCATYSPNKPAIYVLEVNAGYSDENNINAGDKLTLKK